MQSWKSQFPACVTLLGFKSMDKLKDYHQIRTPLFLYPDEKVRTLPPPPPPSPSASPFPSGCPLPVV